MFLPLHELLLLGSNDEKDSKEGKDNNNDKKEESGDSSKIKESTYVGKEVVKEVVKEAAHEAVKEVVRDDDLARTEDDKPRTSRFNTKKFEHVFGNIIQSAHSAINDQISSLKSSTENSLQSTKKMNNSNENEIKYDDIYENDEKSASSVSNDYIDKSDFHTDHIVNSGKEKVKEKDKEKDIGRAITKTETKERIEWFKCYGRLADNELNVEKGQVYLGLLLE